MMHVVGERFAVEAVRKGTGVVSGRRRKLAARLGAGNDSRPHGLALLCVTALLVTGCAKQSPPDEQALAHATKATAAAPEAKPELTAASATLAPATSPAAGLRPISFDAIKFPIEKGEPFERAMLTPAIEKLLGKRIRIRGWIQPFTMFQQEASRFVLVRDDQECCFGPGAAIYDCIWVHMRPGKMVEFSVYPIAVEGVLSLEETFDPITGEHRSIYRLDAEVVR